MFCFRYCSLVFRQKWTTVKSSERKWVLSRIVSHSKRYLKMNLVSRLRRNMPVGIHCNSVFRPVIALNSIKVKGISRYLSQPAMNEEEEAEVEIDQRRLPTDYDPSNFDPAEHRSPPTDRVFRLVDEISGLTLVEVAELSSILMKKLGMKDMPTVGVMKAGAAGMAMKKTVTGKGEEEKPEKTVFELKLESYDAASKLKIVKEVRSFTNLGIKEAKDLVEKTPSVIRGGISKEEGEQIIEKMKAVGAKVVME